MKRFSRSGTLVVGLGALAASLLAGQGRGEGSLPGQGLGSTERCLSAIELSVDQKTAVQNVLESHRAALRTDVDAKKASERKLREDVAKRVDKCVLGQDLLDQEANAAKIRGSSEALRTRILVTLTPEQQARFNECADSRRARAKHPNRSATR